MENGMCFHHSEECYQTDELRKRVIKIKSDLLQSYDFGVSSDLYPSYNVYRAKYTILLQTSV